MKNLLASAGWPPPSRVAARELNMRAHDSIPSHGRAPKALAATEMVSIAPPLSAIVSASRQQLRCAKSVAARKSYLRQQVARSPRLGIQSGSRPYRRFGLGGAALRQGILAGWLFRFDREQQSLRQLELCSQEAPILLGPAPKTLEFQLARAGFRTGLEQHLSPARVVRDCSHQQFDGRSPSGCTCAHRTNKRTVVFESQAQMQHRLVDRVVRVHQVGEHQVGGTVRWPQLQGVRKPLQGTRVARANGDHRAQEREKCLARVTQGGLAKSAPKLGHLILYSGRGRTSRELTRGSHS